jgi:hypothetical protein
VITQELEPTLEVGHLRHLLDIQPGCLLRLSADGQVLAASDAALALLGATSLGQALGRDFAAWVASDQRDRWRAFAAGIAQGYPASIECDITAPSGDRLPTLIHGVPLADHPDGVASMAIAARAVAGQRLLESAVVELEGQLSRRQTERSNLHARLADAEAGRDRLRVELAARDADVAAAEAARQTAEAGAARALADVQQLELALASFAARKAAERERPAVPDPERDAAIQTAEASRAAAVAALDNARAERDAAIQTAEAARAAAAAALDDAHTERDALQDRLARAFDDHSRLVGELRTFAARLDALAGQAVPASEEHPG